MDYYQNGQLTVHSREQMAKLVVEQNATLEAGAEPRPGAASNGAALPQMP